MTDRISSYIVVLEENVREDDAVRITTALSQIKGVLTVTPHKSNISEVVADSRIRIELLKELVAIVMPSAGLKGKNNE